MRCSLCGTAWDSTALYGIHGLHAVLVCTIRGASRIGDQKLYSGRARIGRGLLVRWGPNSLLAPSLPVEHGSQHAGGRYIRLRSPSGCPSLTRVPRPARRPQSGPNPFRCTVWSSTPQPTTSVDVGEVSWQALSTTSTVYCTCMCTGRLPACSYQTVVQSGLGRLLIQPKHSLAHSSRL